MKTVIITGSARGFGYEMIKLFRHNNFNTVLCDINNDALLEAKEKLNLISYSSVSDSENVMFVEIGNILKDYPLSPNNHICHWQ